MDPNNGGAAPTVWPKNWQFPRTAFQGQFQERGTCTAEGMLGRCLIFGMKDNNTRASPAHPFSAGL